jgi:hypothetical protein
MLFSFYFKITKVKILFLLIFYFSLQNNVEFLNLEEKTK